MIGVAIATIILLQPQAAPGWRPSPMFEGLAGAEVRAVEATADGSVWLAVRDRGLARIDGGQVEWSDGSEGPDLGGIATLHEDRSGRLWAAGLGGFAVFEGLGWVSRSSFGEVVPRVVFGIHEDVETGDIWLAANGGAGRQTADGWETLRVADGVPHAVVHDVVVDADRVAWLACRTGLARVVDGSVTVLFDEVNFRSALRAPDGVLWFGTPIGVYSLHGSSWRRHLEGTPAYPRLVSADGTVWAAGESGLVRYLDGEWETIDLPGHLEGAEVFDLDEARDGTIWVATSRGAAHYAPGPP